MVMPNPQSDEHLHLGGVVAIGHLRLGSGVVIEPHHLGNSTAGTLRLGMVELRPSQLQAVGARPSASVSKDVHLRQTLISRLPL